MASSELNEVVGHLVYRWPRGERGLVAPHSLSSVLDALLWYAEKQRSNAKD